MINFITSKNKPYMNLTFPEELLYNESIYIHTTFALVSAAALIVYNLTQLRKFYPFIIVGLILVTLYTYIVIYGAMGQISIFFLFFFLELECCLIIIYSFTVINGSQEHKLTILSIIMLALAIAYPIVAMLYRVILFFVPPAMVVSAIISLCYSFISSRIKSPLNKIFCIQFGIICLLIGVSHCILILMIMNPLNIVVYSVLLTRSVFPLSCLILSKGLKDKTEESLEEYNTLL